MPKTLTLILWNFIANYFYTLNELFLFEYYTTVTSLSQKSWYSRSWPNHFASLKWYVLYAVCILYILMALFQKCWWFLLAFAVLTWNIELMSSYNWKQNGKLFVLQMVAFKIWISVLFLIERNLDLFRLDENWGEVSTHFLRGRMRDCAGRQSRHLLSCKRLRERRKRGNLTNMKNVQIGGTTKHPKINLTKQA